MDFSNYDITSTKRTKGKVASKYRKETASETAKKPATGSISRGASTRGSSKTRATTASIAISSFIRGTVERTVYQWCEPCEKEVVHNRDPRTNLIKCTCCSNSYKVEEKKVLN